MNYYSILQSIAEGHPKVRILSTAKYFCRDDSCSVGANGVFLCGDAHYLSATGSRYLGKSIVEYDWQLAELGR